MRIVVTAVVLSVLWVLGGCIDSFGKGGTGEVVVPTARLRDIDATDMRAFAATAPSTQPIAATAPTTKPLEQVKLTVAECRQLALQNNLDLKVDLLNPTISREGISEEEAKFEALFTGSANYRRTDSPTSSRLSSSQGETFSTDAGVELPLRTGGSVKFDVPLSRSETNNEFSTLNPAYTANNTASLNIPLLRGAGLEANSQSIRVAFYQWQQTEARTKLQVINVLATVDRDYWRLYAARRELEVRKQEYDLAVAQLERAKRQVTAGIVAEVEIVRAESGVADTLENIIIAENAVRDRQRDLKRILNKPGLEMDTPTIIVPDTPPGALFYKLDPDQLVKTALHQRMEMLDVELQIAAETSNVAVARNGLLPLLGLNYTYNVNGLGGTFNDAVRMTRDRNFDDHTLGLRLEIPLGNEAARSRLRRAIANRLQQLATREQRVAQITQEILAAVDTLDANWQRILAARKRVVLAARLRDVETRQFVLGLRTSTDVLNAQTSLANAQSSEVSAVTDYQISQVDIAFATGTVLGASKVAWEPIKTPSK